MSGQVPQCDTLFELLHNEMIRYFKQGHGVEAVPQWMERMGYRVGLSLAEKTTKEETRFKEDLEIIKFICKDIWAVLFKKQIDNLRTNHNGVFVLQDNRFKLLMRISQSAQYVEHAPLFMSFTCGVIRGALSNLGVVSTVTSEITVCPTCKFQVVIQQNS